MAFVSAAGVNKWSGVSRGFSVSCSRQTAKIAGSPVPGSRRCRLGHGRIPVTCATNSGNEIKEGSKAPTFSSVAISGGGTMSSDDLGSLYVIYFYPRDATSGCTCEAIDFTTMLPEITSAGALVVGVSRDSVESHDSFARDSSIGFPLIADVDGVVSDAYGTFKLKNVFGKEMMAMERSTFIVKDGIVVRAWRGIKADGHARQVVTALKSV